MKFQVYLLLAAGVTTASMLGACQKTSSSKSTVTDGRTGNMKPGISEKAKPGEAAVIQCAGTISDGDKKFTIDKMISWDRSSVQVTRLIDAIDMDKNVGDYYLEMNNQTGRLSLRAVISKDTLIAADGGLNSSVNLLMSSVKNDKKVIVDVKCGNKVPSVQPLKLDKENQIEMLCAGVLSANGAKSNLHKADGGDKAKVGLVLADSTQLQYDDLKLSNIMDSGKLLMKGALNSDLKQGSIRFVLETADKSLSITSDIKNELGGEISISSELEKQNLVLSCAVPKPAGKISQELGDETPAAEDMPEIDETVTSTTSTTLPPVDNGELNIEDKRLADSPARF